MTIEGFAGAIRRYHHYYLARLAWMGTNIMFNRLKKIFLISGAIAFWLASTALAQEPSGTCPRAEPTPVLAASNPGLRSYRLLQSRNDEMRELVSLGIGESVQIRQWGCEYVVTTFRLESTKLQRKNLAGKNAYLVAADLLRRLDKVNAKTVYSLNLAAKTLKVAAGRPMAGSIDESIPVDGDGEDFLQTQVQLTSARWRKGIGVVEFSLMKGPL